MSDKTGPTRRSLLLGSVLGLVGIKAAKELINLDAKELPESPPVSSVSMPAAGNAVRGEHYTHGTNWKAPVKVATTSSLPLYIGKDGYEWSGGDPYRGNSGYYREGATLTGAFGGRLIIDGTPVDVGDFVLVKNEIGKKSKHNGIYCVDNVGVNNAWVLTRHFDAPDASDLIHAAVFVECGDEHAGSIWVNLSSAVDSQAWCMLHGPMV